jgi:hypothetical protein
MTKKNILTTAISSVLTFVVVRLLIGLVALDYAFSVIPGWHTIILTENMTLTLLTIILMTMTLVVMGLFKIITKILLTIWTRLTKD